MLGEHVRGYLREWREYARTTRMKIDLALLASPWIVPPLAETVDYSMPVHEHAFMAGVLLGSGIGDLLDNVYSETSVYSSALNVTKLFASITYFALAADLTNISSYLSGFVFATTPHLFYPGDGGNSGGGGGNGGDGDGGPGDALALRLGMPQIDRKGVPSQKNTRRTQGWRRPLRV